MDRPIKCTLTFMDAPSQILLAPLEHLSGMETMNLKLEKFFL